MLAFLQTSFSLWFYLLAVTIAVPQDLTLRNINIDRPETDEDSLNTLRRAFYVARAESPDEFYSFNRTYLTKSWADATLFELDNGSSANSSAGSVNTDVSIALICKTCYVNGSVVGNLTLTGELNFTEAVDGFDSEIYNIGNQTFEELKNYVEEVVDNVTTLNFGNIPAWPTLDVNVDLENMTGLSDAQIHIEFDDLEVYLDLDIKLSAGATYTLPIFTSEDPVGISVQDLTIGAVFSVDLILIASSEIDIEGGIHVKFDDGLAFDFEFFSKNVSTMDLPGGSYEFLPIKVDGEGSIQALLRLKASLGVNAAVDDLFDFSFSSGIETDVFAYIADFTIEANGTSSSGSKGCELFADAKYTFAVGAGAGATVAVDTYSWGPAAATTVPVWYTTLASVCAGTKSTSTASSSMATSSSNLGRRDGASTAVSTASSTYTIVSCAYSGMVNCPVNIQHTSTNVVTTTATLTILSGSTEAFPTNTASTVTSAIAFGTNVHNFGVSSGTPTSYVQVTPSPTASTSVESSGQSSGNPIKNSNGTMDKLIIGLSVGLGVPFVATVMISLGWIIYKSRKYKYSKAPQ